MEQQLFHPDTDSLDPLLEVVDAANRPLGVFRRSLVLRQHLFHRAVYVLVFDAEHRVFIQKRHHNAPLYPGRWDLSVRVGPMPGEALADAAMRGVADQLHITPERLGVLAEIPASPETGYEFMTMFGLHRPSATPRPDRELIEDGQFFGHEEIECMIKEFRELLTPTLVSIWERGLTRP